MTNDISFVTYAIDANIENPFPAAVRRILDRYEEMENALKWISEQSSDTGCAAGCGLRALDTLAKIREGEVKERSDTNAVSTWEELKFKPV